MTAAKTKRSAGRWPRGFDARAVRLRFAVAFTLLFSPVLHAAEPQASARERRLDSQSRLASALMGELSRDATSGNLAVSPASAAGMLTALVLGADQPSVAEIGKVLQVEPGPMASRDVDALRDAMTTGRADSELTSATRIVFAPSGPPTDKALRRLKNAGIEAAVADLGRQASVDEINAWVRRATRGTIGRILDGPSPLLAFVALNALHFKSDWEGPFEAGNTSPGDFRMADGRRVRADFMHGPMGAYACRDDDRFVAVDIPFKGRRFSMVVLTTKDGPADFGQFAGHMGWLAGRDFRQWMRVIVDMPRLKIVSRPELLPVLARLGLDAGRGFPNLTSAPVRLAAVRQIVDIGLDEQGAEVAAVTGGFAVRGAVVYHDVSEIVVDKPFAFALRDDLTGLIIAAGFVASIDGRPVTADVSPRTAQSRSVMTEEQQAEFRARKTTTQPSNLPLSERLKLERDF